MQSQLETVLSFHKEIENGNVDQAMTFLTDSFLHHSTYGKADKLKAAEYYKEYIATYPRRKFDVVRSITDGNQVFLHIHAQLNDGGEELIYTDFFRLEGDKIAEQWTISSAFANTTPSGHSSTDGVTEITDLDKTEENKETLRKIIVNGLMDGDPSLLDQFISSEQYIQHNKDVADGFAHFQKLAIAPGRNLNYSEMETVLGEGNFAVVRSKASWTEGDDVTIFVQVDLFRFENGLAVEHWDNVEPYGN